MLHRIEFVASATVEIMPIDRNRMEQVRVIRGDQIDCRAVCHVVEGSRGPVEVADIDFSEGRLLNVPCKAFRFMDQPEGKE